MEKNRLLGLSSIAAALSLIVVGTMLPGCKGSGGDNADGGERGEPVLIHEAPQYDEATGTFSLVIKADSVGNAKLRYSLIDGDSVIMRSDDGTFSGIAPFDEGYDVKLEVEWPDTVIERRCHIMDFVVPAAPVEKISAEDFAKLINSKAESLRRSTDEHVAQGVIFRVVDSKMQPQMLPDAITLIENGLWQSVEVVKLQYNDNNLITEITVRPIGEKTDDIDMDDEDYDY
ncbi:MAG: hypothetical protein K2M05_00800 [Paramuribaculum sp.]|nr:hypothetical protein [Paramuribaculum sp.]MDE6304644.1 hypothetical protein [Paramuribaculum sp.]